MNSECNIEVVREGIEPTIVVVNGFLSESGNDINDWLSVVDQMFPTQRVIHLDWPSSNLIKLLLNSAISIPALLRFIAKPALIPATLLLNVVKDWKKAMSRAEDSGKWLANYLNKQGEDTTFIIMGHSLGSRVAFNALADLNRPNSVHSLYSFGGAVSNTNQWVEVCSHHPELKVINCYSTNDWTLKFIYRIGTLFSNTPLGLKPIPECSNSLIYNVDLSNLVDGHTDYKKKRVGEHIKERVKVSVYGDFRSHNAIISASSASSLKRAALAIVAGAIVVAAVFK